MKNLNKLSLWVYSTVLALTPFSLAQAASTSTTTAPPSPAVTSPSIPIKTPTSTDPKTIIDFVSSWVLGFSAAIAVLFIIISGLQMVTSAGNKDRYEAAKKTLTYAVLGLIIIVLAYAIVKFTINVPTAIKLTN